MTSEILNLTSASTRLTASVLDDGNAEYTPAVSEVRSGTSTYSHSGLKNMCAQTDAGTTPAVQATRTYDAFGATQSSTGSWQGPFGAAGAFGYQSPQTGSEQGGLHLLGHRYYDASTGRFLTRDPIGDGSNWYACCENNPIRLADPSGLWALDRFLVTGDGNASDDVYDGGLRQLDDSWTRWQGHFADENRRAYGPVAAGLVALEGPVWPGIGKPIIWLQDGASPYTTPIRLLDILLKRKLGIVIPGLTRAANALSGIYNGKHLFNRTLLVLARWIPIAFLYGEVYLAIRAGRRTMAEPLLEPVLVRQ